MSVEALAAVLHHSRARGTAKLVLLGIANHQGDGGAWPAITTLARYANVHSRNVVKALRQLEALGELRTLHQGGGLAAQADETRPNLYQVLVTCPADCDGSGQHRTTQSRRSHPVTLPLWPVDNDDQDRVALAPGAGHLPEPRCICADVLPVASEFAPCPIHGWTVAPDQAPNTRLREPDQVRYEVWGDGECLAEFSQAEHADEYAARLNSDWQTVEIVVFRKTTLRVREGGIS